MTGTRDGSDRQIVHEHNPMSEETKQDPEAQWRILREVAPVHHYVLPDEVAEQISSNPLAARPTKEFWSTLRYSDVLHMLTNPQVFSSTDGPGPERMVPLTEEGVLLFADDPTHLRQRRLVAKAFTPRAVQKLVPSIQATVDSLIDECAARGSMEVMKDLSVPMSIRTIVGIMGVPEERAGDFHRWGNGIVGAFGGDMDALNAGFTSLNELFDYVQTLIEAIRSGHDGKFGDTLADGVLAGLVNAEVEGTRLTDDEIRLICMQLITAGFETTSTATANGIYLLCTHPEQRAALEGDPASVEAAVEEIVRYASPLEGLFRTTNHEVELGGCPIPKDAKVRAVFASANRDEDQFTDANTFRIDRDPEELKKHLGFGRGPHACIGAPLARAELRAAFKTLFRRLPGLELDRDRPPVRNTSLTINGFKELHLKWDPGRARPAEAGS